MRCWARVLVGGRPVNLGSQTIPKAQTTSLQAAAAEAKEGIPAPSQPCLPHASQLSTFTWGPERQDPKVPDCLLRGAEDEVGNGMGTLSGSRRERGGNQTG